MTYRLHPAAERDIADASDFYRQSAGIGVAQRFLDEVERVARLIARHPDGGTPLTRGRRMFHLNVFPYTVVYKPELVGVLILIVRHHHRRPGYGMSRR